MFLFSAIGGGTAVVTAFFFLCFRSIHPRLRDYCRSDNSNQYLFNTVKVAITNTGNLALTNIVVNYGSNAVDKLTSLSPGEKVLLLPPENSSLKSVTVTVRLRSMNSF